MTCWCSCCEVPCWLLSISWLAFSAFILMGTLWRCVSVVMLSIAWSCSFCTFQCMSLIRYYGLGSKCPNWLSRKYLIYRESLNSWCWYWCLQFDLRGWVLDKICGGKCWFWLFHTVHSTTVPNWRNPTRQRFQVLFNQSRTSWHDWDKTRAWNYWSQ